MAIIKCPECGGNVSDQAPKCPHCGFDMENRVICVSCGHVLSSNDAKCPQCGTSTPWVNLFVTCPECGELIRRGSETCPKCGILLRFTDFCEECGHALDKSKATCTNCGHPAPWARTCPECGNSVMSTEKHCDECGFDMEKHFGKTSVLSNSDDEGHDDASYAMESSYNSEDENNSRNYTKWILIGIATLLVGAGVWYIVSSHNEYQAKVAWEKHVNDSIQAAQERLAAEEAERQRLEQERRDREFQEYMEKERLERERKQAEEDAKGPEWIEGTWQWKNFAKGGIDLALTLKIDRSTKRYVAVFQDGETQIGTYRYNPDRKIIEFQTYGSHKVIDGLDVDEGLRRISMGHGEYMWHL